ncbi:DUF721 domain-containing protein [Ferrimonas marina]|uniref:DUF721 domain-containing protein n=1 Tax=Ferrimonas marina TaxID=299255 RepID=A0A1M5XF90_9GAMM|nr:DciA family protein [Ferrimonas marina]SHH98535.1 hypothetical protein SAMN02745129_3498 [Ferrimonas marina]
MANLAREHFAQLQRHSGHLGQLQAQLLPLLDPAIRDQIKVANLRGGTLVIELASAAWATRLQYQHLDLLSELRKKGFPMLTTIQFKVNPELSQLTRQKPQISKHLSKKAGNELETLANTLGGELGEKLKKLAAHSGGQSKT